MHPQPGGNGRVVLTAGGHMGINMNKFGITALSATALLGSLALMNAARTLSPPGTCTAAAMAAAAARRTPPTRATTTTPGLVPVSGTPGTAMTASAVDRSRPGQEFLGRHDLRLGASRQHDTSGTNEYDRKVQSTSPGTGYVKQELTYTGSGTAFASAYMSAQGTSGFGAASRTEGRAPPARTIRSIRSPHNHGHDAAGLRLGQRGARQGWHRLEGHRFGHHGDALDGRYGASPPTGTTAIGGNQNLQGNLATSTMAGWELVGSFADLGTDNSLPFGGAAISTGATKGSSWWLISTTTRPSIPPAKCKTCTMGDDAFKINFIATLTPKTPPNRSARAGFAGAGRRALAGVLGARRRPEAGLSRLTQDSGRQIGALLV